MLPLSRPCAIWNHHARRPAKFNACMGALSAQLGRGAGQQGIRPRGGPAWHPTGPARLLRRSIAAALQNMKIFQISHCGGPISAVTVQKTPQ
jgi:hypothetical protein